MRRQFSGVVKYCKADHLAFAEDVPQPEIDVQPAIGLHGGLAGDEALRLDHAPIAEARRHVDVEIFSMKDAGLSERKRPDRSRSARHDGRDVAPFGARQ